MERGINSRSRRFAANFLSILVLCSSVGAAQQRDGTIQGVVLIDSSGEALAGAIVTLLDLRRTALTNLKGEFRFQSLEPGRHPIEIRHVGYVPLRDSVTVLQGGAVDLLFQVFRAAVALDTVSVRAGHPPHYLDEFNDRRKSGFGHFIDSTELRRYADNRNLPNYLAGHFAGLSVVPKSALGRPTYLANMRSQCSGKVFSCAKPGKCLVSLYVDGRPVYIPGQSQGDPPDLDQFRPEDYAAVEWYAGGASVPAQYNATGSVCGVLLLWSRR